MRVNDKKPGAPAAVVKPVWPLEQRKLPKERSALTHRFQVAQLKVYVTVGLYPDRTPGEIFIHVAKEGSTLSGMLGGLALAISMALQHGVPLRTLVDKFKGTRYDPSGVTDNQSIPSCTSIPDYIFRWMEMKFLAETTVDQFDAGSPHAEAEPPTIPETSDDLPLPEDKEHIS